MFPGSFSRSGAWWGQDVAVLLVLPALVAFGVMLWAEEGKGVRE